MYSGPIGREIALSEHLITFISEADEGSYLFKGKCIDISDKVLERTETIEANRPLQT